MSALFRGSEKGKTVLGEGQKERVPTGGKNRYVIHYAKKIKIEPKKRPFYPHRAEGRNRKGI